MSLKVTGTIVNILDVQSGESAKGEWKKVTFIVDSKEDYNNIYAFDLFGADKVDEFLKYNKVGKNVDVDFNVRTNEYNGKYFTSLSPWKIFKAETQEAATETSDLLDF